MKKFRKPLSRRAAHGASNLRLVLADRALQILIGLGFFCISSGQLLHLGTHGGESEFSMYNVEQSLLSHVGRMRRPYGMPPQMFADYIAACKQAGVSPQRITQAMGTSVRASAGTHAKAGTVIEAGVSYDYGTAIDVRTRDLKDVQRKKLLSALADHKFFGWYREKGSFARNKHIHAGYAGYRNLRIMRAQFHDWANGRTGLVGHARETYWVGSVPQRNRLRAIFFKSNPVNG